MNKQNYSVLYVDDEEINLRIFEVNFRRYFKIFKAISAKEGLKILHKENIQVVVSDQRMPEITGIEFLKKVKSEQPTIKLIILTGYTDHEVLKDAINSNTLWGYLNKPYNMDNLKAVIHRAYEAYQLELDKIGLKKELDFRREWLDNMMDTALDGIITIDDKHNIIDVNKAACNLFEYSFDELIGKPVNLLIPKDKQKFFTELIKTFRDEKSMTKQPRSHLDVVGITAKGETVWLELSLSKQKSNGGYYYHAFVRDISERKASEQVILENEAKFRSVYENSLSGIPILNLKGQFINTNKRFIEMFGYSYEELSKMTIFDITHPDDRKNTNEKFKELISGEISHFEIDKKYLKKNGEQMLCRTSVTAPIGIDGTPMFLTAGITDVTEHKIMEAQIQESELRLREAQRIAHIGHWNYNPITDNHYWSDELYRILDMVPQAIEASSETYDKNVCLEDRDIFKETFYNALESKQPFNINYRLQFKNKTIKYVHHIVEFAKDTNDNIINYFGTVQDITKQSLSEISLKKSEEKFRTFTDSATVAIFVIQNLSFIYVNKETEILFDYNEKELLNMKFTELVHPDSLDLVMEKYQKLLAGQKGDRYDAEIITKSGRTKIVNISAEKIEFEKNSSILVTCTDITLQKETEKELIKAKEKAEESDRLKTEFLNNMSHEIRTPLNGIIGFTEFLNDPDLDEKKRQNFVKIIQNSGNQLLRIIEDILEISRLETKQARLREEPFDLNDMLFDLYSIFDIKTKENVISLYLEKGLTNEKSIILSDQTKLHKILSNLIENAFKYTTNGHISFGYQINKKAINFFVSDSGIGIPKNKFETIFERFFQVNKELSKKVGGLGLGLAIVKENVTLLGGHISVESEIMKGSTFKFDIPFKPHVSDIENYEKNASEEAEDLFTFLIVEDEEVNFMLIEILLLEKLKIKGNIIHAINGKEAVDICKKNRNIDIVLMDLKMPIMNGYEATKLIKEFLPDLPIIAQSAYCAPEDKIKAKDAGCIDFISKPINKEILKSVIKNYIK